MKQRILTFALALTICVFLTPSVQGQTAPQPGSAQADELADRAFRAANELMDQKKPAEALLKYKEALALIPGQPSILFNGGLAAYLSGNYADAVDFWKQLKAAEPLDWRVRAKLIQTYQALGKIAERDNERSELFELRRSGKSPELSQAVEYCREQFEVNQRKIMAFEHFELKGDRALRYVFSVIDQSGKGEEYRISLGSYDGTNAIWHETAKPKPKKEDRLFHLDGYFKDAHATYGMFSPEPSYEETRAMVVQALEGKLKPQSSTTYGSPVTSPEKPKP